MPEPVMYETHSHTPLCGHAYGEPQEYAAVAIERNLRGYTVTCHNPMPDGFGRRVRMSADEFPQYLEMVEATRESFAGDLDVLLGLECDYFPGYEQFLDSQIASAPFHYILGSVHPQIREFRDRFMGGSAVDFQRAYFEQLAAAAETGLFDAISHPDLVKNMTVNDWDLDAIWSDICNCLDRIAKSGTAMELNTSGAYKAIREMNPGQRILDAAHEREIPIVIGADAHRPERVGDLFAEALMLLAETGFEEVHYFRDRQRQAVPIQVALASLTE